MYSFLPRIYTNKQVALLIGGAQLELNSIGKNIRKYRLARNLRQEDLAELAGLSTNYVGAVERGEKLPALETFIEIVNTLGVSADMVLSEVVEAGYKVRTTQLSEQLEKLSDSDRRKVCAVVEALIKCST